MEDALDVIGGRAAERIEDKGEVKEKMLGNGDERIEDKDENVREWRRSIFGGTNGGTRR